MKNAEVSYPQNRSMLESFKVSFQNSPFRPSLWLTWKYILKYTYLTWQCWSFWFASTWTFQILLLKFKPAMWCLIVTSTRCCSTDVKITSFLSFKVFEFCQFPHSKYPEIILPSISRKEILSCCCKPPGEKHTYVWVSLVLWFICPHLGITIWIYVCQDDF